MVLLCIIFPLYRYIFTPDFNNEEKKDNSINESNNEEVKPEEPKKEEPTKEEPKKEEPKKENTPNVVNKENNTPVNKKSKEGGCHCLIQ